MDDANLKEWALYYASIGWAVFPIKPPRLGGNSPGKAPLIREGFRGATRDPAKIEKWWAMWPDANIGIATGQISDGLLVIDLDIDENKGLDGYHTLKEWEKEHGELPETCQSISLLWEAGLLNWQSLSHLQGQLEGLTV